VTLRKSTHPSLLVAWPEEGNCSNEEPKDKVAKKNNA
jgi:hypothetical protein